MNAFKCLFLLVAVAVLWTTTAWAEHAPANLELSQKMKTVDSLIISASLDGVAPSAITKAEKALASAHQAVDSGNAVDQRYALQSLDAAITALGESPSASSAGGFGTILAIDVAMLLLLLAVVVVLMIRRAIKKRRNLKKADEEANQAIAEAIRQQQEAAAHARTVARHQELFTQVVCLLLDDSLLSDVFNELSARLTKLGISQDALCDHRCYPDNHAAHIASFERLLQRGELEEAMELAHSIVARDRLLEENLASLLDSLEANIATLADYKPLPAGLDTLFNEITPVQRDAAVKEIAAMIESVKQKLGDYRFAEVEELLLVIATEIILNAVSEEARNRVLTAVATSAQQLSELELEWDRLRAVQMEIERDPESPDPPAFSIQLLNELIPQSFANARSCLADKRHCLAHNGLATLAIWLKEVDRDFEPLT